jgi:hypothetical protein
MSKWGLSERTEFEFICLQALLSSFRLKLRCRSWWITSNPEIAGATSVRGWIGGKEAIDHEVEVAPANKTHHDQIVLRLSDLEHAKAAVLNSKKRKSALRHGRKDPTTRLKTDSRSYRANISAVRIKHCRQLSRQ